MAMTATYMMTFILMCCIMFVVCSMQAQALGCDSCGRECASACGTRHFRTCCFNYLRKRSSPPVDHQPPPPSPSLKLELLLAAQLARNYLNNGNWPHIGFEPILAEGHWKDTGMIDMRNSIKDSSDTDFQHGQKMDPDNGNIQLVYDS
uniref:CSON000619 protein n=1 Tax=Culicoides sonorensis TaxID=179676 RepID=A0A336KUQ2_CULSO